MFCGTPFGNSAGKKTVVVRGRILGAPQVSEIHVERGRIVRVVTLRGKRLDAGSENTFIGPSLFDIQVNGAGGVDLQGGGLCVEQVHAVAHTMAAHGVSRWIPTLVTGSLEEMEHGCRVLSEARQDRRLRRILPGIHLEGPFISPLDGPRGAHPQQHVRPPSVREFNRLLKAAQGAVAYITLAPEQPGALRLIRAAIGQGVLVSLGHHSANAAEIAAAVDAGAKLSTHLGNGSAPTLHRQYNHLWPQLAEDRLHASFIADLHHVPAPALKTFIRAKQPGRTILISDAVHLTGLPPGKYAFAGSSVELLPNGKICLSGTDLLAGSGRHLLQGVVNAWRSGGMTLEEAFASATRVPAGLFGLPCRPWKIEAGATADFIVFNINPATGAATMAPLEPCRD